METEDLPDRATIRKTTDQTFNALCGEHPGAVVIRHSDKLFRELRDLDDEEAKLLIHGTPDPSGSITEHPKVEIGYSGDPISGHAMDDSGQFAPEKRISEEGDDVGKMHVDEQNDWSEDGMLPPQRPKRDFLDSPFGQ